MRLIDLDKQLARLYDLKLPYEEQIRFFLITAEVVEPKRGRWINEPNCWYRCSVCGEHYPSIRGYMTYNYCPNCGAKMDEVEKNDK